MRYRRGRRSFRGRRRFGGRRRMHTRSRRRHGGGGVRRLRIGYRM